jgi:hypothetical protein
VPFSALPKPTNPALKCSLAGLNILYGAYAEACRDNPTSARTERAWNLYLEYSILFHRERGLTIVHPPNQFKQH